MKLGVMIECQEGIGWPEWRNIVNLTEDLGFESLWRSDHFFSLEGSREQDSLEAFVSLTYAASHTKRITFGSLVCPMSFRHPAIVARMAVAIQQLSDGRFCLGLGAGWFGPEHEAFGIPSRSASERAMVLSEGVAAIQALSRGEEYTVNGDVFKFKNALIRPASPLPILIGGGGEKYMIPIVARFADEWNVPGISLDYYRHKTQIFNNHCKQVARDPESIARSMVFTTIIAPTRQEAEAKAKYLAGRYESRFRPGSSPTAPVWLVGDSKAILDQIHSLAEARLNRIILQFRTPPDKEELQLVATGVLPFL